MPIDPAINQPGKIQETKSIDEVSQTQALDAKAVQKLAKSAEGKSVAKLLAEGEKDTTVTTHSIKSMMASAAQSGIDLSSKKLQKRAEEKMQRELAQLEKGEDKHEQVSLSNYAANMQKNLKDRRAEDDGQGRFMFKAKGGEKSQLAKEFMSVFARYNSEYNPELQSELKELESKMFKRGFSQRELLDMKQKIKNAMREEIQSQIKDSMLSRELTSSDLWTSARYTRMMNGIMSQAQGMFKLGGKDFGGFRDGMARMLVETMGSARDELKSFIGDELNESITRGVIKGNQEYMSKFDELQKLATRTSYNFDEFISKIDKFMEDEGLSSVKLPKKKSLLEDDSDENDGKKHGQQSGEQEGQENNEEEKEMLMDMLRAAFLEKALKGGLRTKIKTMFKMREVKKGLMRLGVYTPELIEKVKNEANTLAGMKIMDMLKDAVLERSTLMDLKSTEYKLVKRKIRGLLKNAKALGIEIGEETLERLIGEANKKTFELIKREISNIDAELEGKSDKNLLDKREQLMTVMKRIKEETFIPEELPPEEPEGKHEVAEEA